MAFVISNFITIQNKKIYDKILLNIFNFKFLNIIFNY